MQYITTTQLRTKSKDLVETLKKGKGVDLVHRSKIVGTVMPKKEKTKIFNAKRFLKKTKNLNLPKLSDKEIEKRYREYMMNRHGKDIS